MGKITVFGAGRRWNVYVGGATVYRTTTKSAATRKANSLRAERAAKAA